MVDSIKELSKKCLNWLKFDPIRQNIILKRVDMPSYDYQCLACNHRFEEFHSILAEPIKVCPKCGKSKVQRLISTGGAIIFKGKGFHSTDYRSPEYIAAEKKEKEAQKPKEDPKKKPKKRHLIKHD